MLDLIFEYKWFLLVGAEATFWVLSCAFLVLRYLFDLRRVSFVVLALIVLDNLIIAALGFLDYARTGEFAVYQFIAVAIIVYGLTFGKRDFERLDAYLKRGMMRWKGQGPPPGAPPQKTRRKKATE
jgi:hypothetical protein